MKRAHVYVSGMVQGVLFRYRTQEQASRLGVGGWVKNLLDGRVEAVFEGEGSAVDQMIAFCKTGPPRAHVTDVELRDEKCTEEFNGFSIRR